MKNFLKNFLKTISNGKANEIELNILDKTIKFSEIKKYNGKQNIYFLANIKNNNKRNSDKNIIEKKYFVFDIDIRQNYINLELMARSIKPNKLSKKDRKKYNLEFGKEITNEDIKKYQENIKEKIKDNNYFKDYSYIIYSGNGLHLYYLFDNRKPSIKEYSLVIGLLQKERDKLFDKMFECDKAVNNIGRIMRLPSTINIGMKTKFGLEPISCDILESKIRNVKIDLKDIGEKEVKRQKKEQEEKIKLYLKKEKERKINFKGKIQTYEAICKIPLNEIIEQEYGVEQKNHLFLDPKENDYIGILYFENKNIMWHGGSSRVPGEKGIGYNTFTYTKTKYNLSDSQTFDRFNNNYINIKEIDKQNQKDYMQDKEIEEGLKEIKSEKIEKDEIDRDLERVIPYTRGTENLDLKFGKFERGRYGVVLGESGSGKTNFCFFTAKENIKNNVKVCFITMEMTVKNLFYRLSKKQSGITIEEWNTKQMPDYKKKLFKKNVIKLNGLKEKGLEFVYISQSSIEVIKEFILQKKKEGVELFYIDNLDYITAEKGTLDYERVNEVSRTLKHLSTDENITIFLIHHFNKGTDKDRSKPRGFGSVRGSGKVENDIDYGIRVWRDQSVDDNLEEKRKDVNIALLKDRENGLVVSETIYYNKGEYQDERPEDKKEEPKNTSFMDGDELF